jgi:hypothetical protein
MSISMDTNEIRIVEHIVTDVTVVAEFAAAAEAGKDPEAFLDSLLNLGAKVVALGSSTASAQKIDASVDQAKSAIKEVAENFGETIERQVAGFAAEDGTLVKGFTGILDQFKVQIDEMTAGEDSPLRAAMLKSLEDAKAKIHDDVVAQVANQKKEIADLLDLSSPLSPLRSLSERLDALQGAVAKVHLEVAKEVAVAELVEAGTQGGLDYEDEVVGIVQRLAAMAGDDAEACGNVTGRIPKSKKGDAVVDLRVGATIADRVVVEAKNKALSKLDWERECQGSKQNRAANGFIGLCKHVEDMPNASRMLILDSQSIVLAFDPEHDDGQLLFLVYQLVKMNTLSSSGRLDEFNIVEIRKSLDDATKALDRFDNLTKNASAIENSVAKIKQDALAIRSIITESLGAAQLAMSIESNLEELDGLHPLALEEPDAEDDEDLAEG